MEEWEYRNAVNFSNSSPHYYQHALYGNANLKNENKSDHLKVDDHCMQNEASNFNNHEKAKKIAENTYFQTVISANVENSPKNHENKLNNISNKESNCSSVTNNANNSKTEIK
jgi:hypothetical protein